MKNKNSCYPSIMKGMIKKTLEFCIYWFSVFLAMNDKIGFPMHDEQSRREL